MRKVAVLLSAYNGARYLSCQIDSVLCQDYPSLHLFIRDDGSTEDFRQAVKAYEPDSRVTIVYGENIGVVRSFFQLLGLAGQEYDFFAFCDQDDYWEPNKISRAILRLDEADRALPRLYCSRTKIADAELTEIGYSRIPLRGLSFENALVQNVVTGCTAVFDRKVRDLVLGGSYEAAVVHDWWLYLVASAFGIVIFDEQAYIKYRQHASNVIGMDTGIIAPWLKRLRRFIRQRGTLNMSRQAENFLAAFGPILAKDKRETLDAFIGICRAPFFRRISLVRRVPVYRHRTIDEIILRILLFIGRV
ncbi:MAG: glycosyltransferase family 2 protein [Burkholderiales bacterium]